MLSVTTQRNDIQGLRALAVIAVIAFHVNKNWLPGGFIGVDIFFVISGYLITSIIMRDQENEKFHFGTFYLARVRRIVPAYVAMLVITSMIMAILLTPRDFGSFEDSLFSALYFNSNHYFAHHSDYFSPASYEFPLLHTWSLAVEMQFYLILPAALVFIPRSALIPGLALVGASLLAFAQYQLWQDYGQEVYYSLYARVPEFLFGSLLALLWRVRRPSPALSNACSAIGLALILISFLLVTEEQPFPGLLSIPACVGTAMVIASRNSAVNKLLSIKTLVWFGALSYSLYLWHWPVLVAFRYVLESYVLPPAALVSAGLITLICAYLSYRYIESPFRGHESSVKSRRRTTILAAVSVVLIAASGLINTSIVKEIPVSLSRYAIQEEICHGKVLGDCFRGDPDGDTTILLLGDSHAAQLNYFADMVGGRSGTRFDVVTASSCVPIEGFDINRISERGDGPCARQIDEIQRRIEKADAIIIAGKWRYHVDSEVFRTAFESFLKEAELLKKPVLVISQVPMLQSNVQRLDRFAKFGWTKLPKIESGWEIGNHRIKALTDQNQNAEYIDLLNLDIFENAPFFEEKLMYFDSHHLNELGSKTYGLQATPYIADWISRKAKK